MVAPTAKLRGLLALVISLILCPPAAQAVTKSQRKCVEALNKNLAGVVSAQAKGICSCIHDGAKGKLGTQSIEECISAGGNRKLTKAKSKTRNKAAKKCLPGELPDFGATDPNTVNRIAIDEALALPHDIFGPDLDSVIIRADDPNRANAKKEGKCQLAVAKTVKGCQLAKFKAFNKCKKDGLKDGSITDESGLEACMGADPKGMVAKFCDPATGKLNTTLSKKCSNRKGISDLADLFPGCQTDTLAQLAACLDRHIECRVCRTLNSADGLTRDCDDFDDGIPNGSCPKLLEILGPAPGESADPNHVFLYFLLSAETDPSTVEVRLESSGGEIPLPLSELSASQGWTRVDCVESGSHSLHLSASNFAGTLSQDETIPFECDVSSFALGAEINLSVTADYTPEVLRVVPIRPLRSGATYAVVITDGVRAEGGQPVVASAAFRSAAGLAGPPAAGIEAFYSSDPNDPQNPFPSERMVDPNGRSGIPDGFTARSVPDIPRLAGVRTFLRDLDALSEEHRGYSPSSAVIFTFDGEINLETTGPENLFMLEITNPGTSGTNLPDLLQALQDQRGIDPENVALATIFPTEDLTGTLAAIRAQIAARAQSSPPVADFTDPDPNDSLVIGIFDPNDLEFDDFFEGSAPASAGFVARGRFLSPDYRENGRFPDRFVDGSEVPPHVELDFLLVLPAAAPPPGGFPTVLLQHGFGGNNSFVTSNAEDFTDAGLAVIGINAPEHGTRGVFLNFFDFDDFNAFGNNFRQGSVDLMQLVQLVIAGIDLDPNTSSELRPSGIGYLGVSLGGVLGGVFASAEPALDFSVLNVPGGRLAQFAGSTSSLAAPFLGSFATEAGIPMRTCAGDPLGTACDDDDECAAGETCEFNEDFVLLLDSALPNFQTQLDPGDGISYVRQLRIEPLVENPRATLLQEGVGDIVVTNPLTEALANGIGLPANRPDSAALGIAGLWRFPPPGGHGIFGQAEVRAQAITFLQSGGTVLPSP